MEQKFTYLQGKEDQLNQKAEELSEKFGGECIPIHNDLGTLDGVEELVAKYSSFEESLDFLVNNAGANAPRRTFRVFSEGGWDKVMDLNVKSMFFLSRNLTNLLKKCISR